MDQTYFKGLLDQVDFSIAEHEMVYDKNGNPVDYRYLYVNQPFCDQMGRTKEDMIGQLAYEVFPNIEQTWLTNYQTVIDTGLPMNFTNYTKEVDRYFNVYAFKSGHNRFVTSFKDVTSYINTISPDQQLSVMSGLMQGDKIAYFEFDLKEKHFSYSPHLVDMIGKELITYEDYLALFSKYMHPMDRERFDKQVKQLFAGTTNHLTMQFRFLHQQTNQYKWLSFFVFVDQLYRQVPIKLRGLVKDIDDEKRASTHQEQMDRLFKETRKIANIATFYFDFSNNTFRHALELDEFTGVTNLEELDQMRQVIHPHDLDAYDYSTREIKNHPEGMTTSFRIIKDGSTRYIQSSIFPNLDEAGDVQYVFGIMKDMTEQEVARQEVEYFANHDVLTGLYNRNNFEQKSDEFEAERELTIMVCDVDGLKLINDAFGHIEGDTLLQHLADIFREVVGEDNVYRIGGDEFALILLGFDDSEISAIEQEIIRQVKKFRIFGVGFDVSLGYAHNNDHESFEGAFRNAENIMYRRKLTQRKSRKSTALDTIMQTMHEKTEETEEHCHRVSQLSTKMMNSIGRKREYEIEEMRLVANFHDIGKISISDSVLMKPGPLTDEEYNDIKYHSESGYKIISNIIDNEDIAVAILYHHERWDGKGYPHGIKEDDIPLYSRIVAICDAYDAMTTERVYSKAISKKEAVEEINRCSGTQFDPELVTHFNKIIKKW